MGKTRTLNDQRKTKDELETQIMKLNTEKESLGIEIIKFRQQVDHLNSNSHNLTSCRRGRPLIT